MLRNEKEKAGFFCAETKGNKKDKKGHVKVQEPSFSSNSDISNTILTVYTKREKSKKKKAEGTHEKDLHIIIKFR